MSEAVSVIVILVSFAAGWFGREHFYMVEEEKLDEWMVNEDE